MVTKTQLIKQYEAQKAENKALKERLAQQDLIIAKLQKMVFGPTSERYVKEEVASNQIPLFGGNQMPQAAEKEKQTITYQRDKPEKKKRETKRIPLPEDLPRIDITIEPLEDVTGFIKIGEEVTEILDIIPPQFRVIRLIRPKYAKPQAKTEEVDHPIVIAPMPSRVIDKGIASTRLMAYIIMSKFIDHLPYYRQIKMFQRIGVNIKSNTINGWIAKNCVLLEPLYDALCKYQFSQPYLQADETTIKVLRIKKTGKKGKAHTGYYWVYYNPIDNHVVFIFDPGRGRVYPAEHLKNFSGKLQTDGLSVYDAFDKLPHIIVLACMAHVRRKFVEALSNDKERAQKVLLKIQQLYKIEEQVREENYSAEQRLNLRQEKALPIMRELKSYLEEQYNSMQVLPKSAIGQAIKYALGQWKYLERYLDDGRVEIDNNLVENAIRPVALGRKNYLFAGSEQGAKWGAIIYTLLGSAIRHGHNPLDYLTDVLRRLPDSKTSQLHQFFPANWTKAPESELDLI
jgi:transposase